MSRPSATDARDRAEGVFAALLNALQPDENPTPPLYAPWALTGHLATEGWTTKELAHDAVSFAKTVTEPLSGRRPKGSA